MYIIREIFNLRFGHFKQVKPLLEEAVQKGLLPHTGSNLRILSDFTGKSYRLIIEEGSKTLADFETALNRMAENEWKEWYDKFKPFVESSYREILKVVM